MKPLVIYHANCADGFGAAFAAWMKFGDEAEYLPMQYDERTKFIDSPVNYAGRDVYVFDFSFQAESTDHIIRAASKFVMLDHHKTAFEELAEEERNFHEEQTEDMHGEREYLIRLDNNKSGALLAWEYFHPDTEVPRFIQHIDDRDRWQFKLEGTREFHAGLMLKQPWTFEDWKVFYHEPYVIDYVIEDGECCLKYFQQQLDIIKASCTETINIQDFPPGLCCNAHGIFASELGNLLAKESGTFGATWYQKGDGSVVWSLRSIGDFDVSAIAKLFGGGGHKNAAGFVLQQNAGKDEKGITLWHTM